MARVHTVRIAVSASACAALLTAGTVSTAQAAPSPPPSPAPGPSLPGSDDPTTIPTGGPSLPGEEDAGAGAGGAEPKFSEPPDNIGDAEPPVKVDPDAAGLRLADGAKLAPSKVLDIKFVTEDLGGEERREDSTEKTKFTLQAEVLFPKDSSKLNSGARSRIRDLADEIERQESTEVNVFGFTDDLGSYAHGRTLSKNRASVVQKALADELGSEISFNVRGYSEDYPIADNKTEEGRKKNRRVEVSFPRKD
ncbi:OmpA family protein [Streptomyces daliensis]|uniref:OmpA family protein n=1 Tax=Streptomyces daliensis TaxID=299421 RepID=A0A8T4J4L6_9ACTN|nr:OmpA family protein [Streptomyces daliensis]